MKDWTEALAIILVILTVTGVCASGCWACQVACPNGGANIGSPKWCTPSKK